MSEGIVDGERNDSEEVWYDHLRKFVDDGISGFVLFLKNPMFSHPDRIWSNGMTSAELHNLYPVLLGKQMHVGFRQQTNTRPVIHMEKGYLGMQQFVASTAGTFYNARHAITAVLNYGLSGHVNTSTNMHLITREGIHADYLLAWSRIHSQDHFHHPDFLEQPLHELFQRYARLRYRLLPYLYATAHVAARTGMPIARAMPLLYPDDRNCRELSRQYMLGDFLLVAVYTDQVYLPEGNWIDYWTGKRYSGSQWITYTVPAGAGGPLFVRSGAIIPMWRFALHPFHLSRLFKKETGTAYSDYVMAIRMTQAKKLLSAGHKVYETASRCGFKDAGNFSKAFSKYWGIPPASFKAKRE
ncbi:helix-turn-helix domain-containing protein [Paenibacillus oceani]|uniref:Helix-turn-helix domain-containing protein n=1 Tax=Paenibacillus oceani TaxID=2772510 RepID=A0A927H162_9BACL|nr:helix-turn-helix domain-containing protein [Paenibacillus oceani]MBD2864003.1 helix-turn-helix domain-containing protein [Paenibacillus oceani]